jgi:hypothetical protein
MLNLDLCFKQIKNKISVFRKVLLCLSVPVLFLVFSNISFLFIIISLDDHNLCVCYFYVHVTERRKLPKKLSFQFLLIVTSTSMLGGGGSLSPRHGASSGCGWRRRPPDTEGSCEYIEQAVADRRQGVVLQLRGGASG